MDEARGWKREGNEEEEIGRKRKCGGKMRAEGRGRKRRKEENEGWKLRKEEMGKRSMRSKWRRNGRMGRMEEREEEI